MLNEPGTLRDFSYLLIFPLKLEVYKSSDQSLILLIPETFFNAFYDLMSILSIRSPKKSQLC
jgi:hypothetical protein